MLWIILMLTAVAAPPAQPAQSATTQPIPRAQFITEMDSQFRKMDADKNGQLTHAEIEQYQKLSAVAEAQGPQRALFAELDNDKNGQLSPAEFAQADRRPHAAANCPADADARGRQPRQPDQPRSSTARRRWPISTGSTPTRTAW